MKPALSHTDTQTIVYAITTVVLPFAAFVINFLFLRKSRASGWVSSTAILLSSILAVNVFFSVWDHHQIAVQTRWFTIGRINVYAGLLLNNLSVLMLALVPVVALPVHIYSTEYMKNDSGYGRYFTYLSLFCFSMMAMVVMKNILTLYAFWELVGFSSYLLIGFWFDRPAAVQANKKAFIMNRVGDIGLLVAIIILYVQFHTFDIVRLFGEKSVIAGAATGNGLWISKVARISVIWQYIAFGGVFLAVAAKSAQFPLHTWLPDAMEGPTSVSALIHAATMVAAGVFLLGRFYPMFNETELNILAITGCFTAFMASTIALTQNDIKRILAYSTISQLGFMVMSMGIGAYPSSLFHLLTHAFFKCLLFLVAGIVIHQVKHIKDDNNLDIDPQNILHMGGLRKRLPFTFITAVVAGLALVGLPLTSGYLSKDGILIHAFEWSEDNLGVFAFVPVLALLTSWLTAFYVARLIVKVFFGEFKLLKMNPGLNIHISDGGWQYKLPLMFLALCCLFPLFSLNPLLYENSWLFTGLSDNFMVRKNMYHTIIPALVNIFNVVIMYGAYVLYVKRNTWSFPQTGVLYRLSFNEWYIDRFYNRVVVKFVLLFSNALYWLDSKVIDGFIHLLERTGRAIAGTAAWLDKYIVDGLLHLFAQLVQAIGNFARRFQNGKVQYYLFSMLLAVIVVFILKILIWT